MPLRSSIGARRKSLPSSSIKSNAQSTAVASCRYPRIRSNTASPLFVADDRLTVDQARAHRQHCYCRDDLREALREAVTLPGEQPHPVVIAPSHEAISVVLDLVNPAVPYGRLLSWTGQARLDEVCLSGRGTLTQHDQR